MKIREYQFPESNTDKAGNHDFEQRDPLKVKPAEPEKFVPPVLIEDLLHDDTVHTDDGHSINGADPVLIRPHQLAQCHRTRFSICGRRSAA